MDVKNFDERSIKSWPDSLLLYEKFTENKKQQWVFRGLPDAKYKLETSLERARARFNVPWSELGEIETKMIRQFRRQAHRYLENPPKDDDTIQWLALMQHFGSPTRFQDWTYSFFVAVFFAVETAKKHCAVWAIDMDWLRERAEAMFPPDAQRYPREGPPKPASYFKTPAFFELVFCNPSPSPLAYTLNPDRLNERLIVQQGVFIAPADISKPFEENLETVSRTDPNAKEYVWKIIINDDVELRRELLFHLHRMNINRASLFPGLGGFAESLATYLANPVLLGRTD